MASAAGSLFARAYAGHTGVDPVHDGRVGRLPGPLRRRDLHRQGPVRRRCVCSGARTPGARERTAVPRPVRRPLRAYRPRLGHRGRRRLSVERSRARAAATPMGARRLADSVVAAAAWCRPAPESPAITCRSSRAGRFSTTFAAARWRRHRSRSFCWAGRCFPGRRWSGRPSVWRRSSCRSSCGSRSSWRGRRRGSPGRCLSAPRLKTSGRISPGRRCSSSSSPIRPLRWCTRSSSRWFDWWSPSAGCSNGRPRPRLPSGPGRPSSPCLSER